MSPFLSLCLNDLHCIFKNNEQFAFLFLTRLSSTFILDAHFSFGCYNTTLYWLASGPPVCFFSVSLASFSSSSCRTINITKPSCLVTVILSLYCYLFQPHGFNNIHKLSILFPDQVFLKIWTDSMWIWWSLTTDGKEDAISGRVNCICSIVPLFISPNPDSSVSPISPNPVLSLEPLFTTFWLPLRIQFSTFAKTMPSRAGSLSSTTTNTYQDLSGHFH